MTEINELERLLKALANKRRLALLHLMQDGGERNVADLARAIRLSYRATSQHLRILDRAGLLERKQEGLEVYYSLAKHLPPVARKVLREL